MIDRIERFYSLVGIPTPSPFTAEERDEFDREMDEADRQLTVRRSRRGGDDTPQALAPHPPSPLRSDDAP